METFYLRSDHCLLGAAARSSSIRPLSVERFMTLSAISVGVGLRPFEILFPRGENRCGGYAVFVKPEGNKQRNKHGVGGAFTAHSHRYTRFFASDIIYFIDLKTDGLKGE